MNFRILTRANEVPDAVTICAGCDAVYDSIELQLGEAAHCAVCRELLARRSRLTAADFLALTLAAMIFFIVANIAPVLSISMNGTRTAVNVWQAALSMRDPAVEPAAVALLMTTCVVPLIQLTLLLFILLPSVFARRVPRLAYLLVTLHRLRPWGMVEVFFLGSLVVIVKLAGWMPIAAGPGLWTLGAFTLLLAVLGRFDAGPFWAIVERDAL